MISCDHNKSLMIGDRGERGRGSVRKTAIGFRRRFIQIAHRSGISSGLGDTETFNFDGECRQAATGKINLLRVKFYYQSSFSIYQANTCRAVSAEYVRDGRPQAVANAHRIAESINWASNLGRRQALIKPGTTCRKSARIRKTSEHAATCTSTLRSPRGGGKNRLINL